MTLYRYVGQDGYDRSVRGLTEKPAGLIPALFERGWQVLSVWPLGDGRPPLVGGIHRNWENGVRTWWVEPELVDSGPSKGSDFHKVVRR